MKICIDPGHGGRDPGTVGPGGTREKDIALAVAKRLAAYLAPISGAVLTRTDDRHLGPNEDADLAARVQVAERAQADYFISIHCNSATSPTAKGVETFALAPGGQGERLAKAIQARLVRALGLVDRGVKFASFYVLRKTTMPAVLVELAFLSNPAEEKLLRDSTWQDRAAWAIAQGVAHHLGKKLFRPVLRTSFRDVPRDHWAADDIQWLDDLGIIRGDENGFLRPGDTATRAEVFVITARVLEYMNKRLREVME